MKMPADALVVTTGHFAFGRIKITPIFLDRQKAGNISTLAFSTGIVYYTHVVSSS